MIAGNRSSNWGDALGRCALEAHLQNRISTCSLDNDTNARPSRAPSEAYRNG